MRRMLINATQPEEIRVALVDGQKLYDLDIENRAREQKLANIYKGRITRVEPSLEACFVDYGAERHGFLPIKEVSSQYFTGEKKGRGRPRISEVLKEGTEVIVQVEKEERGNKGAALTTFVSLAGRYMVLMPNKPGSGGISRRIEGAERDQLRSAMKELQIPKGMGIIVRTEGAGRNGEELQWDLNYLLNVWGSIDKEAKNSKAPHFLFQESNIILRAIRDYLKPSIGEVYVDHLESYQLASAWIEQVMPEYASKVKYYDDELPLFNRFQIEGQIETAFEREVKLPSGGSIVIDVTEALVSIDINSSRATRGGDIEETALKTNLEAAEEIARQLRLRDIGGLIVIDFIDMTPQKNRTAVEDCMRRSLEIDRARLQIAKISTFGLMEMSRQRLRPSLEETVFEVCPRCEGQGTIRGVRSLALSILRLIEEEAQKEFTSEVHSFVPLEVASFLLNEKRPALHALEKRQSEVRILVVARPDMETPHYHIRRVRPQDGEESSFSFNTEPNEPIGKDLETATVGELPPLPEPAVKALAPTAAPARKRPPASSEKSVPKKSEPGLVTKLIAGIKSLFSSEPEKEDKKTKGDNRSRRSGSGSDNRRKGSGDRSRGNRNRRNDNSRKNESGQDSGRKPSKGKASDSETQNEAQDENNENRAPRSRNNRRRRGRGGNRSGGGDNQNRNQDSANNNEVKADNQDMLTREDAPQERQPQEGQSQEGQPQERQRSRSGKGDDRPQRKRTREDVKELDVPAEQPAIQNEKQQNQPNEDTKAPATSPEKKKSRAKSDTPKPAPSAPEESKGEKAEAKPASRPRKSNLKVKEAEKSAPAKQVDRPVYTRPINDPRVNPTTVTVEIETLHPAPAFSAALDTARPAAVTHTPREIQRPANDPRSGSNQEVSAA
jgi:ribonuclease E